jgi:ubiquinone biosynthesis protein UbiJ
MGPLETLLRPLAALLNRQIKANSPARELCVDLEGRAFAVRVHNSSLAMYFVVAAGEVQLTNEYSDDPDVVVSGSLISLARLAAGSGDGAIRDGTIELAGDAETAQKFQRLLRYARPDLEEELSGALGDTIAHNVGKMARSFSRWGQDARTTMRQNVSEYLQEESRAVPARHEINKFQDDVDKLRDDVDRIEARMNRLDVSGG